MMPKQRHFKDADMLRYGALIAFKYNDPTYLFGNCSNHRKNSDKDILDGCLNIFSPQVLHNMFEDKAIKFKWLIALTEEKLMYDDIFNNVFTGILYEKE